MYLVDELGKLQKDMPEVDSFVFLFPKSPLRGGSLVSGSKKFICTKNEMPNVGDKLSIFVDKIFKGE